jgi:two-component system response regulator GlrR
MAAGERILIVDDDPSLLKLLGLRLESAGYNVRSAKDGRSALNEVEAYAPELVITDLKMGEMDGMALLDELRSRDPGLPVIILTAHGTIPDAVTATRQGAFGFLTKPVDKEDLIARVDEALRLSAPGGEPEDWSGEIITRSQRMEALLQEAKLVAATDSSVLIRGQSGTGKELLARAIHKASPRRQSPFVAINCGAIPEQLLESELFGHEKGAFTGAANKREGLLEAARGGTVFLDEIGDMPLALQVKLLRVLQDREIRPVGSNTSRAVDVRVISATHTDLEKSLETGDFREDLFYRLNVVSLDLPPLSERREDIPLLVNHFLEALGEKTGRDRVYAPEAMELLVSAPWPGNVRQLYNVVEQNVALSPQAVISVHLVQKALGERAGRMPSFAEARDEFTRGYLVQLLKLTEGNVSQAARLAQRNRTEFYKLLSRHDVEPGRFKQND